MPDTTEKLQKLDILVAKRGRLKGRITRLKTHLDKNANNPDPVKIQLRIDAITNVLSEFDTIQAKIEELNEIPAEEQERDDFENYYFDVLSQATQAINNAPQTQMHNTTAPTYTSHHVRLPQVNLHEFYGSYGQWVTFHDTFNSLINNDKQISKIEKFYYLKSSLKGEAAQLIQSIEITDNNYDVAWSMLKDRYENTKLIIHTHVKALFDLYPVKTESHTSLRKLLDNFNKNVRALNALKQPTEHWSTLLIYILASKLDNITRRDYEDAVKDKQEPTLKDLTDFLDKRCQFLETIENKGKPSKVLQKEDKTYTHVATVKQVSCSFCKKPHLNYDCNELVKMSVSERLEAVKRHKLCLNCLRPGHSRKECRSAKCKHCKATHHHLLHKYEEPERSKSEQMTAATSEVEAPTMSLHSTTALSTAQIILATAKVILKTSDGQAIECRALLDAGSMSNFVTKGLAEKLRLKTISINLPVYGLGDTSVNVRHATNADIYSTDHKYNRTNEMFLIINKITENLPQLAVPNLDIPKNLRLADPSYNVQGPIDLLGANIFYDALKPKQIKISNKYPILQDTKLGWIISGPLPILLNTKKSHCNLIITNEELDNQLKKFWMMEDINDGKNVHRTQEEKECEQHFIENTTRNSDGRFKVRLPFKSNINELGESEQNAKRQFLALERKLNKNLELKNEYRDFLAEYEKLRHMTETDTKRIEPNKKFYLPHHAVIKESSTTTRLRVVFNASAKTTLGLSLNDTLMVGPTIQQDLFDIMLRFRKHEIVMTADIEKMFRQVDVHKDDRKFQLILWRSNTEDNIKTYELNTVTYGTASASFLATRALQQAAIEAKDMFPEASRTILEDFYMDDLVTGGRSIEETRAHKEQITQILRGAGFNLRKWVSNEPELLKITNDGGESESSDNDKHKILGLKWNARADELNYTIDIKDNVNAYTKRSLLSMIARLFDPLGLLIPVTIKGRLLMQKLWSAKLEWDDEMPTDLKEKFKIFLTDLNKLNHITIRRKVTIRESIMHELHGFCDASQSAYGACIYLKTTNAKGETSIALLSARGRIAPLKTTTIPRLELCGALLLSQMTKKVTKALKLETFKVCLWSDSMVVLAWIKSTSTRWQTFVANRVIKIQEITREYEWRHVRSEANPADAISRGVSTEQLAKSKLWWHGPEFLQHDYKIYPCLNLDQTVALPEQKKEYTLSLVTWNKDSIVYRFSKLNKLLRVTAFILRFTYNTGSKQTRKKGDITIEEINNALNVLVKIVQEEEFTTELKALKKEKPLPATSKLLQLNPFLDEKGVIRVGGRIKNASLKYDSKHQILLPSKHRLTELIIQHEHIRNLHGGSQTTLTAIRSKFWPINGRNATRRVLRRCITCFKTNPSGLTAQMGNLPTTRVRQAFPFMEVGLDFAGPVMTRIGVRKEKLIKSYICVFVCFVTKAIHLELATDLTTECVLNILKRFIARRGLCKTIHSDNGTNFTGACNEIKRVYEFLNRNVPTGEIRNFLLENRIKWIFIPPRSPHFGGLWEAAVKSTKLHLTRIMGNTRLTYDQFNTVLCQIEAILNSRPLLPLSSDPNDLSVITPGHFLLGRPLMALPQVEVDENISTNRLKTYQYMQTLLQHFWRRWSKEYLTSLQVRSKWKSKVNDKLDRGDLVLIKEDNLPPLVWRLGRVTDLHPGEDNVTRVVTIKTQSGLLKRNITKLCPLPKSDD